jgi:Glycosyltransferase 61
MHILERTRALRTWIVIIVGVFFLTGFLSGIIFSFRSHHDYPPSNFRLSTAKSNVDVPNSHVVNLNQMDNSNDIKIENGAVVSSPVRSKIFLSAVTDEVVPNIVRSWRAAKLDWHTLLPLHNSIWERYGTPEKGKGLRLLVSKEIQVTNFLTQFHESGLSALYGTDHGTLSEYSACNTFFSACMVHNFDKCNDDQLCSWSTVKALCVDKGDKDADIDLHPESSCLSPRMLNQGNRLKKVDPSQCLFYVNQPAVFVSIDSESQSMFYHWWASWSSIMDYWTVTLQSSRKIHFFATVINDSSFFDYFGFISDNCWRRSTADFVQAPPGACFCNTHDLNANQWDIHPKESAQQIIGFLDLAELEPPVVKFKIGIISRRIKRFILNEYELVAAVESMGHICVLLPLERMTLYEQMKEFRTLDVLIGIHGSALDNSVFLHKGEHNTQSTHDSPHIHRLLSLT